jgi:hypothetical protein
MVGKGYGVRPGPGTTDWEVYDVASGQTIEGGLDNQTAWKRLDRLQSEAVNRGEAVTDWLWEQRIRQQ